MRGRLTIAGLALALILVANTAQAAVPRIYQGRTSQGRRLSIDLVKRSDGRLGLRSLEVRRATLTCSIDGSQQEWGFGFGFIGSPLYLDGRSLTLDDSDSSTVVHIDGTFGALHAAGGLRFSTASLTADEEPQLCTTGDLTWTADRTVPPPAATKERVGRWIVHRFDDGLVLRMIRLR